VTHTDGQIDILVVDVTFVLLKVLDCYRTYLLFYHDTVVFLKHGRQKSVVC